MIYINFLIIVLIILLAVLSRKNKSKYKDTKGIRGFFLSMGETLCDITDIHTSGLEKVIQRSSVLSTGRAKEAARDFTVKAAAICLGVMFLANLLSLVYGVCAGTQDNGDEGNLILRQEYDGDETVFDLVLTDTENEEIYSLKVEPVEYTEEEFYERTQTLYGELAESILGTNDDLQHITADMCLSEYDESGVIHLDWSSDKPEILSSDGGLENQSISGETAVKLYVDMEYGEYEKSYSYDVVVEPETRTEDGLEAAKEAIVKLEQEERTNREFTLPSDVSGVHIAIAEEKDYTQVKLMVLGVLVCLLCVCLRYFGLKEKGDKTDAELEAAYVGFVESLTMLIESGMTVKKAVAYMITMPNVNGKLSNELKYAVNMMDTGYDEAYTYEQLGSRLALPGYVRLFNYISQNIRKGNSNLKAVLNNCAYEASQIGREQIKKRGEKTSTKLLFPMIILLAVVMLIIIIPALVSF